MTTLATVINKGTHAARPAAGTAGSLYYETDTSLLFRDNGSSWDQIAVNSAGLSDPMTTRGDVIIRNSSNTTARLAVGAAGKILSSDGTDVSWGNGPMTTQDDIIVGGASGIPTRLAKGSDSQVLTVDPSTHHLVWATPAGGGGVTVQYPGLKPGSPTYDFAGASLDVAFSAHSSQGSFATSNCKTQGEDWIGSALDMQFSGQMGALYVTHSNGDLDFSVGGIRSKGISTASATGMFGIAALNSSGTGIGVTVYDDGNVYFAAVTTWNYASNSDSWSQHGLRTVNSQGDWWLRLTRVSGTWTGYASQSGRAWDKTFSTRADSVTVDRLVFGLLFNTATAYSGRLTADYFQVDV
jgi:hypothetical protein